MEGLIENSGQYRNQSVGIVKGSKVEHLAPPFGNVPYLMKDLFEYLKKSDEIELVKSCVFHYEMEFIHPFEDGNGRVARALTEMALAQDENLSTRYYSLSSQIMAERDDYYRILERTTKGEGDITDWVEWFLECMSRAFRSSNRLLANVMLKARFWKHYAQTNIKERQSKVLNRLLDAGPGGFEGGLTNRKYAGMTHVSRATAQRELADLVQKGILRPNPGGGRSTSYDLCWDELSE